MIAALQIRDLPHYRHDAFAAGLRAAGYTVVDSATPHGRADLLVIWNRYGRWEQAADVWEARGGTVLVAENGYIGQDEDGHQLYAISAHGHNGSGWFPVGTEDRFAALGIDVLPWRSAGAHILVRGQRGIGTRTMASPAGWHERVAAVLRAGTPRHVRVLEHPGNVKPKPTFAADLEGAHACVIWASSMGVRALVMGIPVFCGAPHWICREAAETDLSRIESPKMDDAARLSALQTMAWGQWSVREIASGAPFVMMRDQLRAAA